MKVYLTNKNNLFDAVGEYNPKTNEMKVCKDSILNDEIKKFRGTKSIEEKRKLYSKNNKLMEDVIFKSPSTAGNFVTGRSTNGWDAWKNADGLSLKEIIKND